MALTDIQTKALRAKLSHRHVKTRTSSGTSIAYVEGWHAIAEANRIFGFDSWDRQTMTPRCLWSDLQRGQTVCFYSTKVRITVRAGGTITVREGIGTGFGRSNDPVIAHEIALKAAETDATKRALATFGNPFGLALYDKDHAHVTKPPTPKGIVNATRQASALVRTADAPLMFVLRSEDGKERSFDAAEDFVAAMLKVTASLATIEGVYAFWERHLDSLAALRRRTANAKQDFVATIVAALKTRLRALGPPLEVPAMAGAASKDSRSAEPAALAIPKERRLRDKDHLAFVGRQPCLVCGRRPAQAHHLRFAQPRAMAMKVSDEFTLPLCNVHHDDVHRTGDERAWWARNGIIEPLKFAARLWAASRQARPLDDGPPFPFDDKPPQEEAPVSETSEVKPTLPPAQPAQS